MIPDPRKIITVFSLSIILLSAAAGQTVQWELSWTANSEDDMHEYLIFRGTSPEPATVFARVAHPAHSYTDSDIEKGVLYYYRLKAVDLASNQSEFSEEISAALPKVEFPTDLEDVVLDPGSTFQIDLNNYVTDPDNSPGEMQWSFAGNTLLAVTIDVASVATISAPANWAGQETVSFSVSDSYGFSDAADVTVYANDDLVPQGEEISIFPLPYKEDDQPAADGITFANLPQNSELLIFNMLGEPVYKEGDLFGTYLWDTLNNAGRKVNSGIYIYHIKAAGKKLKSGKLVIVR